MSSESEDRDIVISSRENSEKIMDDNETLRTENQSLRTQLAEKEAEAAVLREALNGISLVEWDEENAYDRWMQMHEYATDALNPHH